MTSRYVVVHGAGGTQGAAIVRRLRAAGHRIRAVGRNPRVDADPAVEPVRADLLDLESLVAAYTGAAAVVVQLPLDFTDDAVHKAGTVLAALEKAAVPRAVFNTAAGLPPSEPVGFPFVDARVRLSTGLARAVGMAAVVGPAGPYLENLAAPWSRPLVLERGEVRYPLPAGAPVPWTAADDLGDAVAGLVGAAAPPAATVVAGPVAVTGPELAEQLAAGIGRPVRWHTIEADDYERMLLPHLGAATAAGVAAAYRHPAPPPGPALVTPGSIGIGDWASRHLRL